MDTIKHIGIGLAATALLFVLKVSFERSLIGHRFEVQTYDFLQGLLSSSGTGKLPILVVDISNVPGGKDGPTPRDVLKNIIEAIVDQRPRAIAVDVDFSPNERGWIKDDDPEFFDFCITMRQKRKIPIFLGIYRTRAESPDTWLGLNKYRDLAAVGLAREGDTRRVSRWIQRNAFSDHLPTIASALAKAYQDNLPGPPIWLTPVIERTQDNEHGVQGQFGDGLNTVEILVNYSKLERLKSETIATVTSDAVNAISR